MDFTRDELIAMCKERKIKGYSGLKKNDILKLLALPQALPQDPTLKFIDLFCGIGGFHQALTNINATCVFACDIDEKCRAIYEKNYGLKPSGDIRTADNIPDFDILLL